MKKRGDTKMKLKKILLLLLVGVHALTLLVQALLGTGITMIFDISFHFIQEGTFFILLCSFFLILLCLPVTYILEIIIGSWKRKISERALLHSVVFVVQKSIEGLSILLLIELVMMVTKLEIEPAAHLVIGLSLFIWEEFNRYSKEKMLKNTLNNTKDEACKEI